MKLELGGIHDRTITRAIRGWPRIIHSDHRSTPCDTGYGSSRFSSPAKTYKILYAGDSFKTAFSEAVIRDRFVGKSLRFLYKPHLEEFLVTEIGSSAKLSLLDFTGDAAHELGIDTDAKGARSHTKGQEFGEALYSQSTLDGLIFESRLNGRQCLAIFDRAFTKLTGSAPVSLMGLSAFWDEVGTRRIAVRRRRGIAPSR